MMLLTTLPAGHPSPKPNAQCDWSLKRSVRNSPLVGTGMCLWNCVWSTCAHPCLDVVISPSFSQVVNLFTDVTGGKENVQCLRSKSALKKPFCSTEEMPQLFWYSFNFGSLHYLQGWPKDFFKKPQINIKFLFNMVDVTGFWKTKNSQSLLHPTPKANRLSGIDNPETSWHKPYFTSELEHLPQKVGSAGRPFLFLTFLKLVAKSRQR